MEKTPEVRCKQYNLKQFCFLKFISFNSEVTIISYAQRVSNNNKMETKWAVKIV